MGSAEGACPAQGWMPTRGTHGVGGNTVLGTQRAGWPEQSLRPSVGTARALSPPLSSCRHACCCPEASPPPQVPSQEGFSVHASTRHWQKRGLDLRVSPACLPLTPVTPQHSGICSDGGMMMKQGSSRLPHLSLESSEPCTGGRHHPTQHLAVSKGQDPLGTISRAAEGPEPAAPRYISPHHRASHQAAEWSHGGGLS